MRKALSDFFVRLEDLFGALLTIVILVIVGLLLAIPYTFLVGWDEYLTPLAPIAFSATILPVAGALLFCFYKIGQDRHRTRRLLEASTLAYRIFWWLLGLILLPIFMNGASLLLRAASLTAAGDFFYEWRYASVIAALIGIGGTCLTRAYLRLRKSDPRQNNALPPEESNDKSDGEAIG